MTGDDSGCKPSRNSSRLILQAVIEEAPHLCPFLCPTSVKQGTVSVALGSAIALCLILRKGASVAVLKHFVVLSSGRVTEPFWLLLTEGL